MIWTDGIHIVADEFYFLHAFAEEVGIKRCWYEGVKKDHPHYDVPPGKKELVLKKADHTVSTRELVNIINKYKAERAQKEVEGACELFNEKIYGKKSVQKLINESLNRQYIPGAIYYSQSLYRDSFIKKLPIEVKFHMEKRGMEYFRIIKLGSYQFELHKVSLTLFHAAYKLKQFQPTLFQ